MRTIGKYENWFVEEGNREYFVTQTGQSAKKVKLIKSLKPEEYQGKSIAEILSFCNEADFCGELNDRSAYCFWKIISLPESNFVDSFYLDKETLKNALICLHDNGIEADECSTVLQALCYILMDKEINPLLKLLNEEEDIAKILFSHNN